MNTARCAIALSNFSPGGKLICHFTGKVHQPTRLGAIGTNLCKLDKAFGFPNLLILLSFLLRDTHHIFTSALSIRLPRRAKVTFQSCNLLLKHHIHSFRLRGTFDQRNIIHCVVLHSRACALNSMSMR